MAASHSRIHKSVQRVRPVVERHTFVQFVVEQILHEEGDASVIPPWNMERGESKFEKREFCLKISFSCKELSHHMISVG
jgi:hypothetical protein